MKITSAQAAKLLRVTPSTIYNYHKAGYIHGEPVQHGLRTFYQFDLDETLNFANASGIHVSPVTLRVITDRDYVVQ